MSKVRCKKTTVPQINLLKQNTSTNGLQVLASTPKIIVRLLLVVFLAVLAYYGWLFVQSGNITKQSADLQIKMNSEANDAKNVARRDELLTRQLQIQDLQGVVASHLYWSKIFAELARVTLKTASYDTMQITGDGSVSLSAQVPSLLDLDKYLQVFDLPDFNKYFSNVRVSQFSQTQNPTTGASGIMFQLKMDYDPSLISYTPASAN
jgi:hypothetical protein